MKLSEHELMQQCQNQLWFMIDSCNAFDSGKLLEAVRLTATLRILLHDKGRSISLFQQLGLKTSFFDSRNSPDEWKNLKGTPPYMGLIFNLMGNPMHRYRPHLEMVSMTKVPFDEWWNQPVLTDINKQTFSRKDIVLHVAEKDGGVHVDPELSNDYYELSRKNSMMHFTSTGNTLPKTIQLATLTPAEPLVHILYTIRQIAHEVLVSRINPESSEL